MNDLNRIHALGAPLPPDEADRMAALRRFEVLDSEPEPAFDRLTRLASTLLDMPIALISLIDDHRQWFKSKVGVEAPETPRDWAFCAHAILTPDDVFVIDRPTEDPRFRTNPLVTGDPAIRFYAGAPLVARDGQPLGTLCVIDRAARPGLTARQTQMLRDLAATVVDELELRLALRRTAEAARVAEQLNIAKSAFMASLSHELRTPMNSIMGFGQLLGLEPSPTADLRADYARHILDSGNHLLSLVNDLVALSSIESGTPDLELQVVSVRQEVDHVFGMLTAQAAQQGVTLTAEIAATTTVRADPLRFRQILVNLIGNAIKYNHKHGAVRVVETAIDSETVRIDICDTGAGIPPEQLARLFTPYDRLGRDQDAETVGTGLGLVIAKRMAMAMAGDVVLANLADGGCRASVLLPADAAAAATLAEMVPRCGNDGRAG